MFEVTLIRGPKPSRTWSHSTRAAALRRVYALADLHRAPWGENGEGGFTINASEWYGGTPAKTCVGCDSLPLPGYTVCQPCGEEGYGR